MFETKMPFDVEHHPLQHEWVLLQSPCSGSPTVISTHFKTFLEKHYYAVSQIIIMQTLPQG